MFHTLLTEIEVMTSQYFRERLSNKSAEKEIIVVF